MVHYYAPNVAETFPVIFFVGGLGGLTPVPAYSDFLNKIVSHGYIVVGFDHFSLLLNYPQLGEEFHDHLERAKGHLANDMARKNIKAVSNTNRTAVMGHSAGNHVIGEALKIGCSLAKAFVMIDPVDGYDPFRIIKTQDLITPGEELPFVLPSLLLDNELDPKKLNFLFPPCAPAKMGSSRWYNATAAPVWNVYSYKYGHIDLIDASLIPAGGVVCPTNSKTNKGAYKSELADTISTFLGALFYDMPNNLAKLESNSSFQIQVEVKYDLKGLKHDQIKPGCTNTDDAVSL